MKVSTKASSGDPPVELTCNGNSRVALHPGPDEKDSPKVVGSINPADCVKSK